MSDSETIESRLLTAAQALAWWGALLGGALLFLHFFKIRYLPNFDISSLMGTIAAVAAMGVITFLVLSVLLVLPGMALVAGDLIGVVQPLPALKRGQRLSKAESSATLAQLKAWLIGTLTGICVLALCIGTDAPLWLFKVLFGATPGIWLALVMAAMWKDISPLAKAPWGMAIFSYLTITYFGSVSFVGLHKLEGSGAPATQTILGIVLAIWAAQWVVYFTKGLSIKLRGAVLSLIGLALLMGTSLSSVYEDNIGRYFGFGQMRSVHLVVTERGCEILLASASSVHCDANPALKNAFHVGPVDIWTRIGTHTLLSAEGDLAKIDRMRTLVPNTEILSVGTAGASPPQKPRKADVN